MAVRGVRRVAAGSRWRLVVGVLAVLLSGNRLTGPVPGWPVRLEHLGVLRLAGNELHGCVPPGFLDIDRNGTHLLRTGGLPLCGRAVSQ